MTMRITGFATGFDSQAIVTALVDAASVQVDTLNQLAYEQELKLAAWDNVESKVGSLRSSANELTSVSAWDQMSTTSSNTSVASASATSRAVEGSYSITVDHLATSHRIGSDAQTDITSGLGLDGKFTIGGQEVTVGIDSSLEDIRDAINLAANYMDADNAVQASIVDTTLVITRQATGATDISLSDGASNVLESLGILDASKAVKNEFTDAKDMLADVMGISVTRSSNTNLSDIISGVTLDLTGEGTTNVTIGRDRDTVRSLILGFIDTYNSTMAAMENQGTTTVGTNEDADAPALEGDSLLRSIQSKCRSFVTSTNTGGGLDEALNSLRKIGITTSGKENRISLVDSEALDDALKNNYEGVEDLFRSYDGGIMRDFESYLHSLTSAVDGSINRRQENIQSRVDSYDDRIGKMQSSLAAYEEQLWEKFTSVETTIASLQSQSSYITSLLDSISANSSKKND